MAGCETGIRVDRVHRDEESDMKTPRVLLTMALTLGGAALAGAQTRGGYVQDPYYGGRPYDGRPVASGPAYQFGLEDGRREGDRDWFTGHSFRPGEHGSFRHADRGYRGYFGDKRLYKEQYRAGYLEGYRMGFRSYRR